MTEPGQRDKDPEAAGKWVNAVTKKAVYPDTSHRWDRALDGVWEEELEKQQKEL